MLERAPPAFQTWLPELEPVSAAIQTCSWNLNLPLQRSRTRSWSQGTCSQSQGIFWSRSAPRARDCCLVRLPDKPDFWTGQPAGQFSLPHRSALRIPRQVSLLDRSACWTGQRLWTSQLPGWASLLGRSARVHRSTFWTGQPPGHVNLPDMSASRPGQVPRQVIYLDRSASRQGCSWLASQTGQPSDRSAYLTSPPHW